MTGNGDLSYAVNGGIGDTFLNSGINDCVADPFYWPLDLNGDGIACIPPGTGTVTPTDSLRFGTANTPEAPWWASATVRFAFYQRM